MASVSQACGGAEAVARLAAARLRLLRGDWWEDPDAGSALLEECLSRRLTERSLSALRSRLSSELLQTPGVLSLSPVSCVLSGRTARYSCTLNTPWGPAALSGELSPG